MNRLRVPDAAGSFKRKETSSEPFISHILFFIKFFFTIFLLLLISLLVLRRGQSGFDYGRKRRKRIKWNFWKKRGKGWENQTDKTDGKLLYQRSLYIRSVIVSEKHHQVVVYNRRPSNHRNSTQSNGILLQCRLVQISRTNWKKLKIEIEWFFFIRSFSSLAFNQL